MKRILRLGMPIVALLILALTVPTLPARATTINVHDGTVADWGSIPILQDDTINEDSYIPGMDIDNVYFTNDGTTLYGRVDTNAAQGATAWNLFPTMNICLSTVAGGAPAAGPRCTFAGTDYRLAIDGLGLGSVSATLFTCTANTLCQTGGTTVGVDAGTFGNVTEFSISLASIGVVAPGGTYEAYIFFDNYSGPPDDSVLQLLSTDPVSKFPLPIPGPSSATLTSFTATKVAGGTKLAWDTSSELSITGYNILRSATGKRADATRITTTPIAATGDGVTGGSYSFTDTSAQAGTNYTYWLEVLNTDGTTHEYPVTPTLTNTYKAYLPLAIR